MHLSTWSTTTLSVHLGNKISLKTSSDNQKACLVNIKVTALCLCEVAHCFEQQEVTSAIVGFHELLDE